MVIKFPKAKRLEPEPKRINYEMIDLLNKALNKAKGLKHYTGVTSVVRRKKKDYESYVGKGNECRSSS